MIIVRIKGGLGNQLFQYAFARSLSYNLNKELFLDISYFSNSEQRKHVVFGLNTYNIKGIIGNYPYSEKTNIGIHYLDKSTTHKYIEGDENKYPLDIFNYEIIKDVDDVYFPAFFDGYFQKQNYQNKKIYLTENFFKDNLKLIREDLKYMLPLSQNNNELITEMSEYDSIALHIRHGDYLEHPDFGICSREYYQNAIELITSKVKNPKFYIFTEDHEWVKNNLDIPYPYKHIFFNEKIDSTSRGYAELLEVMSNCDHFIIANSTFSWWGAFLSENHEKIIITPNPWFQDRSIVEVDEIDNIKTINLPNNYSQIFEESERLLYQFNGDKITCENVSIKSIDNTYQIHSDTSESSILLKDIINKHFSNKAILRLSLKTENLNRFTIYYKTPKKGFCEENSVSINYYEDDDFTHEIFLPTDALTDELLIKPFNLKTCEGPYCIELKELTIMEVTTEESKDIACLEKRNNELFKELLNLKELINKNSDEKENKIQQLKEKEEEIKQLNNKIDSITQQLKEKEEGNKQLNNKIDSITQQLKEKEEGNKQLNNKIDSITQQLKEKEEGNKQLNNKIDSITQQLKEKEEEIKQLNNKIDSITQPLNDRINDLERIIDNKNEKILKLKNEIIAKLENSK